MTFREIAKQVMLSKGMKPDEIEARIKLSSGAIPAAVVDREIPPEDEAGLREALSQLHDAAMRNPLGAQIVLEAGMHNIQANN